MFASLRPSGCHLTSGLASRGHHVERGRYWRLRARDLNPREDLLLKQLMAADSHRATHTFATLPGAALRRTYATSSRSEFDREAPPRALAFGSLLDPWSKS